MKNYLFTTFIFFTILTCKILSAQPGAIDTTFNPTDIGFGIGYGADLPVSVSCIQNDGKIILGGEFNRYNGVLKNYIVRLNNNGTIDENFIMGNGFNAFVKTISMQADGKIILGGYFTTYNGTNNNCISRLNSDGTIDTSFSIGSAANNWVLSSSIQNDGKIIIGGKFTSYNGNVINRIARLNTNGSLDTTFSVGLGANDDVNAIFCQPDGKIIIGGKFTTFNGSSINRIARLNIEGSLDTTFNVGSGVNNNINAISLQSDGKIIIAGAFNLVNNFNKNFLARLNIDGTLDTTFHTLLNANSAVINTICLQNDGKVIIAGYSFSMSDGTPIHSIARFNTDGSFDNTFYVRFGTNNIINTSSIQTDGKIIIGGYFSMFNNILRMKIARINSDGSFDGTFNKVSGADNIINTMSSQNDGKIIIGGSFTMYNENIMRHIARLNIDGSVDNTFDIGEGFEGGLSTVVNNCIVLNNGQILAGGEFSTYNGFSSRGIIMLNSDGTIDSSFNIGTGVGGTINSISVQDNGKFIIGGVFGFYNNTSCPKNVIRINSNGDLDSTFNTVTGPNGYIYSTLIQPDGKIIVGGSFSSFNGISSKNIVRLFSDGTIDTTFKIGAGANGSVYKTLIQPDGKIIICGSFTSYNNISANRLARLNNDGTSDNSFQIGSGANSIVQSLALQSDDKIIIGGGFSTYNGVSIKNFARLNADGTLDNSFNVGAINGLIYATAIQSDGKIIIGGEFKSYNGIGRNRICRIFGGNMPTISTSQFGSNTYCSGANISVPYTVTGTFYNGNVFIAQLSDSNGSFDSPTVIGSLSSTTDGTIQAIIPIGQSFGTGYRIRIVTQYPVIIGTDNGADLTISPSNTPILTVSLCDTSYTLNSQTYNVSGTYNQVITNSIGCDSINLTLNLFLNSSNTGTDSQTACNSYTWIDGNTYTSSTNTPTYTLTNSEGCDSVVTLNLTIINNTTGDTTAVACNSFFWYGTTYTSSGSPTHTFTNSIGCDSIVTLHLTINSSTSSLEDITACDSYTWMDGNTYSSSTNTPTFTLTNSNGCDSVITLNLTIYQSDTTSQTFIENPGFSITVGQNTYSTSGIYIDTLSTVNGCDSIVTTDLTIIYVASYLACQPVEYIIPAGSFDPINLTNATFQVQLSNGDTLPSWLSFDSATQTFSGTAPCNADSLHLIVTCTSNDKASSIVYEFIMIIIDPTNVSELKSRELLIYPNPTNGTIKIINAENSKIEVFNLIGNKLKSLNIDSNITELDLSVYGSGYYILKIIKDKNIIIKKLSVL